MNRYFFYVCIALAAWGCNGPDTPVTPATEDTANSNNNNPALPKTINYQVINTYPHDTKAFTEGLQYLGNNQFLESTGNYGESFIRYTDLTTGKILKQTKLEDKYFGEGCTQINGKVFQMTYEQNTCFVYEANTLKKIKEYTYNFGEGWGMTTDGKYLIISTGSSNLYYYDPETFKEVKRIGVTNQYGPVSMINELEYIKGYVYANKWQTSDILKIDPESGRVVAVADLSDLRGKAAIPNQNLDGSVPEVLNGIAYDSTTNRIFITGKNWPKLFEVKLDN